MIEAAFKAFARALSAAVAIDPAQRRAVTKGMLSG
jgi:imidazoleglycerol phosphate dehydratase HisB